MSTDSRATLKIDNVEVRLGVFHLSGISFEVAPGEVVGYLGHNGAGKSTTFRVISELVRPVGGTVRLGDLDHRKDEREFKRKVSFIGDNQHVYSGMRVAEVLDFASQFYPGWDHAWCAQMCDDLRLPLRAKTSHLSTGMRTKLGLVLGFSPRPEFVVMDEPTSGLDVASSEWIWEVIDAQVKAGRLGALVSSHSRDEVIEQCSRVIVLEDGHIREEIDLRGDRGRARVLVESAMGRGNVHAD